jgi:alpha-maltose-1-phosphate synthase
VLNVAISAIGRFHMFDLARQMLELGQNVTVFTGNPGCRVDADLRAYTRTHPALRVLSALRHRVPPAPNTARWQDWELGYYGKWLSEAVDPEKTDVFDGLDGPGPAAGRRVHAHGHVWVCNRGSAHILTQKALLEEEHAKWGAPSPLFTQAHLERCLQEYAECDAVVVPSDFARRSFLEQGIEAGRIYVQPYGVDTRMFRPHAKADRVFRVLFVGVASIQKGIGYLFDALRPLVLQGRCELVLAGRLDCAARHLLRANRETFSHVGVYPRSALSGLYSQASVLVLPSIQEGLALVQAQAMACGVPVIASRNTGAENLFTNGVEGFIVPARNAPAIRERLEWMLSHPSEREAMGAAAMERVKHLGGWESYGRNCLAMYRELVGRKAGMGAMACAC